MHKSRSLQSVEKCFFKSADDDKSLKITQHAKSYKALSCNIIMHNSIGCRKLSAHVLLNLLNEFGKIDKMQGLSSILSLFFAVSLTNIIIQKHEC